jgi:hypothetical protein
MELDGFVSKLLRLFFDGGNLFRLFFRAIEIVLH